ncbi:MAG TPA: hypothetical protein VF988_04725 [Verrucomicrobiae bacterium]
MKMNLLLLLMLALDLLAIANYCAAVYVPAAQPATAVQPKP